VAAGGTCTISVDYTPTTTDGDHGMLTVDDGVRGFAQVGVRGTGSTLVIAPAPVNGGYAFPTTAVGASAVQTFTITNTIAMAIGPLVTATDGDTTQFAVTGDTCNGTTLAGGATCTVAIAFAPTASGTKLAVLEVIGPNLGPLTNQILEQLSGTAP